jgi:UDP-N-acetylglucosamine 2-epimerase (non-hydrolysing)
MRILTIAGARPNFVKIAPLLKTMRQRADIIPILVHTGQHYDWKMSEQFFRDLEIPAPDFNLAVGSGSHAVQTAEVMKAVEPLLLTERPDLVLVVGDVNSTMAAALTAAKLCIPIAHVEAGLRSFDRTMPEEVNRIVTDAVSDLLFTTEPSARENLLHEGIPDHKIHFAGNVMIDALHMTRSLWERSDIFERLGLASGQMYAVATLHRPANVDSPVVLSSLMNALDTVAQVLPILLPVHPRVRPQLETRAGLTWLEDSQPKMPSSGILCLPPQGYLDFVALVSKARLVLTDSGGIQEETTILQVPCLTLRDSTERPITVTHGTNRVIGTDPGRIVTEASAVLAQDRRPSPPPPLWDGRAAVRIVDTLLSHDFRGVQAPFAVASR